MITVLARVIAEVIPGILHMQAQVCSGCQAFTLSL